MARKLTYTIPEAAAALGISAWTYYRRAAAGELPVRRIGRRSVVPIALLEAWLIEQPEPEGSNA